MIISIALASALTLQPHGDVVLLPASDGPRPALRHVAAQRSPSRGVVLFIHGATFPSALSFAYPMDGKSWMSELADAGFDTWALDFVGYGRADRDPRMRDDASAHAPLGRAKDVLPQIEAAVAHIRRHHPGRRVSIVAHSWGTVPAAMYVIAHPELVDRFVMYGPVVARKQTAEAPPNAWFLSDAGQQWHSFVAGVPAGKTPGMDRATVRSMVRDVRRVGSERDESQRESTGRTDRRLQRHVRRKESLRSRVDHGSDAHPSR